MSVPGRVVLREGRRPREGVAPRAARSLPARVRRSRLRAVSLRSSRWSHGRGRAHAEPGQQHLPRRQRQRGRRGGRAARCLAGDGRRRAARLAHHARARDARPQRLSLRGSRAAPQPWQRHRGTGPRSLPLPASWRRRGLQPGSRRRRAGGAGDTRPHARAPQLGAAGRRRPAAGALLRRLAAAGRRGSHRPARPAAHRRAHAGPVPQPAPPRRAARRRQRLSHPRGRLLLCRRRRRRPALLDHRCAAHVECRLRRHRPGLVRGRAGRGSHALSVLLRAHGAAQPARAAPARWPSLTAAAQRSSTSWPRVRRAPTSWTCAIAGHSPSATSRAR